MFSFDMSFLRNAILEGDDPLRIRSCHAGCAFVVACQNSSDSVKTVVQRGRMLVKFPLSFLFSDSHPWRKASRCQSQFFHNFLIKKKKADVWSLTKGEKIGREWRIKRFISKDWCNIYVLFWKWCWISVKKGSMHNLQVN